MKVVIAAFREQPDAAGAQRALESAGIEGEVSPRSDELPRLCADAFPGGFDVAVSEADADAGIALLQRLWPDEQVIAGDAVRCPMCGSADVFRLQRLWLFALAAAVFIVGGAIAALNEMFLLMVAIVGLLLAITPPWRCRSCKHAWR